MSDRDFWRLDYPERLEDRPFWHLLESLLLGFPDRQPGPDDDAKFGVHVDGIQTDVVPVKDAKADSANFAIHQDRGRQRLFGDGRHTLSERSDGGLNLWCVLRQIEFPAIQE